MELFSASSEFAFVSFLTAGYKQREDTVPLMLSLQEGGADIIEVCALLFFFARERLTVAHLL